jgi:hypothetical protein
MKKNIAIIMGGYSSEYEISLKSGNVVFETLNPSKYNAYRIHIFRDKWVYVDTSNTEFPIDKNDFSVTVNQSKITFDCVFNAIHGSPGEDGFMQAYFKLLNIPQTSCGMYQASLTFNKRDCLSVLKPYGIKTAESFYINLGDTINEDAIIKKVGLPCFVKANKAGSSFGITKVYKKEDLQKAIEISFKEDDEIIRPTIAEIQEEGKLVYGPYAADSFFGSENYKNFDAILAMYHDQGLAPFKTLAFGGGVNYTAGLNKIRTSPDHGTAYELAGKDMANINSFKEAVFSAIQIFRTRSEYKSLTENVLKISEQK